MKSCTRRPTELSASAVTIAVSSPKQRRSPRATLYSPPPSHARKCRVVAMRMSPGSRRSITSPRLTRSQRQPCFAFMCSDPIGAERSGWPGGFEGLSALFLVAFHFFFRRSCRLELHFRQLRGPQLRIERGEIRVLQLFPLLHHEGEVLHVCGLGAHLHR